METVVEKQASSLIQKGHEVTVITTLHDNSLPRDEQVAAGYRVIRFRALNFIENKLGMAFPIVSPFALFKLRRLAAQHDIVHIHDAFYMTSHLAAFTAKLTRRPLYMTQHVAIVDHPQPIVTFIQKSIYTLFGDRIFRQARKIIVYNTNVKKFLQYRNISIPKIVHVQNGVDTDFFKPVSKDQAKTIKKKYSLDPKKPLILFVGRLIPEKGYDLVFESRSPLYETLIVGGGKVPQSMQDAENVRFYGPAPASELTELYAACDVFVFPASVEVFALVVQEAMACGAPVITYDNHHYDHYQIAPDTMIRCKRTAKDIRHNIEKIIGDTKLAKKVSIASRKLALDIFSWKHNYESEYAIYEEILP